LDNITPLRQLNDQVAQSDAHLFRPADAYDLPAGSVHGTPLPPDEPLLDNPPAAPSSGSFLFRRFGLRAGCQIAGNSLAGRRDATDKRSVS
jgi:hypothetical protein